MEIEHQVVRSWNTVRKMLSDRGHDMSETIGDVEVAALAAEHSTFGVEAVAGLAVVFHTAQQSIKKSEMFSSAGDAKHVVLVINTKVSGAAAAAKPNNATVKSLEQEARARDTRLEIWTLKETQYNVTEHELVPKHVKLTPEEADKVLVELCVKNRALLPAISSNDPVARYLLLQAGDVVRIERPSPTSGKSIAYRCCRRA
jgi:DNA-directed RNA polymerase subunit H (RpoH/RPB5)